MKKIKLYLLDKLKVIGGHFKNLFVLIYTLSFGIVGVVLSITALLNGNQVVSYVTVVSTVVSLSIPYFVRYFKNFKNENLKIRENIKTKETKKAMKQMEMASKHIDAHRTADGKKVAKNLQDKQNEKNVESAVLKAQIENEKNKLR